MAYTSKTFVYSAVVRILQALPNTKNIRSIHYSNPFTPMKKDIIDKIEEKSGCKLPQELVYFFELADGWELEYKDIYFFGSEQLLDSEYQNMMSNNIKYSIKSKGLCIAYSGEDKTAYYVSEENNESILKINNQGTAEMTTFLWLLEDIALDLEITTTSFAPETAYI
jgi:hypothetical protein